LPRGIRFGFAALSLSLSLSLSQLLAEEALSSFLIESGIEFFSQLSVSVSASLSLAVSRHLPLVLCTCRCCSAAAAAAAAAVLHLYVLDRRRVSSVACVRPVLRNYIGAIVIVIGHRWLSFAAAIPHPQATAGRL